MDFQVRRVVMTVWEDRRNINSQPLRDATVPRLGETRLRV